MTYPSKNTSARLSMYSAIRRALLLVAFSSAAFGQTYRDLYDFAGGGLAYPNLVRLAQGREGSLYGTAFGAPPTSFGSVYSISISQKFTLLDTLTSQTGSGPGGGLTLGSDGDYYGTASAGGNNNDGVFFKITRDGAYTILHTFAGGSDGTTPAAPAIQGGDGAFYGTTYGDSKTASTVYKYTAAAGVSTIYQFDQAHGSLVLAPMVQAADGTLYGSAFAGGANNCGALFQLTTAGKLLWSYSFPCGSGGSNPDIIIQATDGNLYGATQSGGIVYGTVFKVDQKHAVTSLHTFEGQGGGADPIGGLVQASDGNLYGATAGGGANDLGIIYQLNPNGNFSAVYSFALLTGRSPFAPPTQHTNGKFYGTTDSGGKFGFGTLYSFDMGLSAFCTFVRPIGKVGTTAQILGQGFKGATGVTFNGVPAVTLQVVSDTYITAMVPVGATTGPVVISTVAGPLASNKNFTVR